MRKKYIVLVETTDSLGKKTTQNVNVSASSKMDARKEAESHVRYNYPQPQHSAKPFYLYVQTEAREAKTKKMKRL